MTIQLNMRGGGILWPGGMAAVLLAGWEIMVRSGGVPVWILPPPSIVIHEIAATRAIWWNHAVVTGIEAFVGLAAAAAFGMGVAVACAWSAQVKRVVQPLMVISQTVPAIVLAPLFALWFGLGMLSKIVIVTLVCFFPVAMGMLHGFEAVPRAYAKTFATMGTTRAQMMRMVLIPFALPGFFSGLKIAATYSVIGAVIAEWFGAEKGLGILLVRSAKSYLTVRVFAAVAVIAVMTLGAVVIVEIIARRISAWHYQQKKLSQ